MGVLALSPLPTVPLLAAGGALGTLAYLITRQSRAGVAAERAQEAAQRAEGAPEPPPVEKLMKLDALELEVGYGLVRLVDRKQGGDLLDRISAARRQLAVEWGFVMPPVRIRDNMTLDPNAYRVRIRGAVVAEGSLAPGKLLAMDSGIATGPIDGVPTREPAFGLSAWWIEPGLKSRAEALNYTVVDAASVLVTHLTEVVKKHAAELLSREEVNNLIEQLKEKAPRLVEEAIPAIVKPGELQKVLQTLLAERVPIRDLETIVETLSDWAPKTRDLDVLTEYVRHALRRVICEQLSVPIDPSERRDPNVARRLVCVTLDPAFEDEINGYIDRSSGATTLTMPASVANRFARRIVEALQPVIAAGHQPVVVASPQVRAVVRQILEPHLPNAAVLGYNEIVPGVEVESLGLVTSPSQEERSAPAA
ncbi:MAG: hypothetical protein D6824_00545 [Planctomycetota bacterium]|nr:MAG: hypothetical protein D6824_00545 [Planctomycetota bacterium]